MEEKKCSKCGEVKVIEDFDFRKDTQKYRNQCKKCRRDISKQWSLKNKEHVKEYHKGRRKENAKWQREYRKNNPDKIKDINQKYYKENKEAVKQSAKEYYNNNKEKRKEKRREYYNNNKKKCHEVDRRGKNKRYKNDEIYRLNEVYRGSVYKFMVDNGWNKDSRAKELLGCDYEYFLNYLNDNPYGFKYGDKDLDLDHIIPKSKAKTKDDLKELYHYTNYQLLPSVYNQTIKINNDWDREHFEDWLNQ